MPAQRPSITTTSTNSTRFHSVDRAEAHLAGHLLVRTEQQLLAGLAAGVERAADLGAAEAAVVEQAAVLAGEGNALGDHLVDDVHRHLGESVDVRLARAEVAALDRVVEEPVDAVAVAGVVLGGVDAPLGGDRVRTARRVVERERLDLIAELGERGARRRAGEPGAHHEDLELALVVRVDEADVALEVGPLVGDGPVGDVGVEASVRPRLEPRLQQRGHLCTICSVRATRRQPRSGQQLRRRFIAWPGNATIVMRAPRRCRPARRSGSTRCRRR